MTAILLISLAVPFMLIGFWAWMFNDMINNDNIPSMQPPGFRWPPEAKNQWTICFVVLSLFTAGYYYLTVYRDQR